MGFRLLGGLLGIVITEEEDNAAIRIRLLWLISLTFLVFRHLGWHFSMAGQVWRFGTEVMFTFYDEP